MSGGGWIAPRWTPWRGLVALVAGVVLMVLPLVLGSGHPSHPAAGSALSAQDVASLKRGVASIDALPGAIAEVPAAMVRASGTSGPVITAEIKALLAKHPELGPLERSIADPSSLTVGLRPALLVSLHRSGSHAGGGISVPFLLLVSTLPGAVIAAGGLVLLRRARRGEDLVGSTRPVLALIGVAGVVAVVAALVPAFHSTSTVWGGSHLAAPGPAQLDSELSNQQVAIDEIIPAIEDGGLLGRKLIPPGNAILLVGADPALAALSRVLNDSPQLYGAEVVALGADQSGPVAGPDSTEQLVRDLVFAAGLLALLLAAGSLSSRYIRARLAELQAYRALGEVGDEPGELDPVGFDAGLPTLAREAAAGPGPC